MKPTLALVTLALAAGLVGCSSDSPEPSKGTQAAATTPAAEASAPATEEPAGDSAEALEVYVGKVQPLVESMLDGSETYSDLEVRAVPPSTMEYVYTFAEEADVKAAAKGLEEYVPTLQETADAQIFPEMEREGIASPRVAYTYLNPDGSEIWTVTLDPS